MDNQARSARPRFFMTTKLSLFTALALLASACRAGESVQLELWSKNAGGDASYLRSVSLACTRSDPPRNPLAAICLDNEPAMQESTGARNNLFWISLRGTTLAYWIRYQGRQFVEIGADARDFTVPRRPASSPDSPIRRLAILLPSRQP